MRKFFLNAAAVALIAAFASCGASDQQQTSNEEGWIPLIKDNSLEGWTKVAGAAAFTIDDGVIIGTAVANTHNTFLISNQQYDDFIHEMQIRIEHEYNNTGLMVSRQYIPNGKDGHGMVYGYQV